MEETFKRASQKRTWKPVNPAVPEESEVHPGDDQLGSESAALRHTQEDQDDALTDSLVGGSLAGQRDETSPADNDAMPHGMQQLPPGDPVLSLQLTEDRVLTSHGGKHWTARIWDLDSLDAPSPGPRIGG